jgi:hypothetical protein
MPWVDVASFRGHRNQEVFSLLITSLEPVSVVAFLLTLFHDSLPYIHVMFGGDISQSTSLASLVER